MMFHNIHFVNLSIMAEVLLSEHLFAHFLPKRECQRQAENVDFRRNRMSFFGGQHSSVYSPYTPLHLPA